MSPLEQPADLLLRDMGGKERAEVVLRLWSTSTTHFPPPGISSFKPQEDLRGISAPFCGQADLVHGAPSGWDPTGELVRRMAHLWMLRSSS